MSEEEKKDEAKPRLERELDRGTGTLPPYRVGGWLGERGPDMRKPEDYRPTVTGGLVQEDTPETQWLLIVLLSLLVLPSPIALYLLWRSAAKLPTKIVTSLLVLAWLAYVVFLALTT